jgi:hypothetical protein
MSDLSTVERQITNLWNSADSEPEGFEYVQNWLHEVTGEAGQDSYTKNDGQFAIQVYSDAFNFL